MRTIHSLARSAPSFSLAALALAAVLAPQIASAQITTVWADTYAPVAFERSAHVDVKPYPGGGTVVLLESGGVSGSVQFEVRALDRNGDRQWSTSVVLPTSTVVRDKRLVVDENTGDVAVLVEVIANGWMIQASSIAPDGTLRWTQDVLPWQPQFSLELMDGGFTSGGDLQVAGRTFVFDNSMLSRVSVVSLDGSTGLEQWRTDLSGDGPAGADCDPDGCYLAHYDRNGTNLVVATRLNLLGAVTLQVPIQGVQTQQREIRALSGGRFLTSQDLANEAFDEFGAPLWSNSSPGTSLPAAVTPSGDLVVITTSSLQLFDGTTGALLWTHPKPASLGYYRHVVVLSDGSLCASLPGSLEYIDSGGVGSSVYPLRDAATPRLDINGLALDASDHVTVGATIFAPGYLAREGRTIQMIEGADPSTSFCGPAAINSTGAPGDLVCAGTALLAEDDVSLVMRSLPPGATVLALNSLNQGFVTGPGGSQGNLCIAGLIGRYVGPGQVRRADASGRASLRLDVQAMPTPNGPRAALIGETWYCQAWYRDANPTATSNFTNGIGITFL